MKRGVGSTSNALVIPPAPAAGPYVLNTHVPGVGSIDFSNPVEIAIWGGVGASVLLAPGYWKVITPAILLILRYQLSKISI